MNYKFPQYRKGEIAVFSSKPSSSRNDYNDGFLEEIAKTLGCEYLGESYGYLFKVPKGEEENCGKMFVENYPEFFGGYERIDMRLEQIFNDVDNIKEEVGVLIQYFEGVKSVPNTKEFNGDIDRLVEMLNKMKIQ